MNLDEYEKMYHLEDTYWWFQGRLAIIRAVLERYLPEQPGAGRVLDVGCGTGLILSDCERWNPVGIDFSPAALAFCRTRSLDRLVRGDVVKMPFADNSFDLILALDLMEHVERDDLLIREFNRVLRPGGCLMATVPAHPSLWSDHDIALHHYRRYTRRSFGRLLKSGGFRPLKFGYCISFVHPLIVAFRQLQKLAHRLSPPANGHQPRTHLITLPAIANRALIRLLEIEAALLRHVDLPEGTSLITLAQKSQPHRRRPAPVA